MYRQLKNNERLDFDFLHPSPPDELQRFVLEHHVFLQVACVTFGWIAGSDGPINDNEMNHVREFLADKEGFDSEEDYLKLVVQSANELDKDTFTLSVSGSILLANIKDKVPFIGLMEEMAKVDGPVNNAEKVALSVLRENLGIPGEEVFKPSASAFIDNFNVDEFKNAFMVWNSSEICPAFSNIEEASDLMMKLYRINETSFNLGRPFAKKIMRHLANAGFVPAQKKFM